VFTIIMLISIIGAFFVVARRQARRPKGDDSEKSEAPEDESNPSNTAISSEVITKKSNFTFIKSRDAAAMHIFNVRVTPLFGSFIYALISIILTAGIGFLIALALASALKNFESSRNTIPEAVAAGLAIAAAVISAILGIFTLPVLIARRKGLKYFFTT